MGAGGGALGRASRNWQIANFIKIRWLLSTTIFKSSELKTAIAFSVLMDIALNGFKACGLTKFLD
jgi:hypothetical protein